MQVSIIICFYNAGEKLIPTLEHIKKLNISGFSGVELVLVDNNSNDNSCQIIQEQLSNFSGFAWKVVHESKPGLSNARMCGIKNATYSILLFCDDDNWLSSEYLQIGVRIMKNNTTIAVLGGKGEATSTFPLPHWFSENEAYYAVGTQNEKSGRIIKSQASVYGAGMFVRKAAFLDITQKGFHFFNLGRTKGKLTSGEDSEMCLAFHIAGYEIWYESSLDFIHYIEPKRLQIQHFKKLQMGISESRFITRFYLDYIHGYIPNIDSYFWQKEFVYSLLDLCKSFFNHSTSFEIKRNVNFLVYLLQQRSTYTKNVERIIGICKRLDKNNG